jgi:hypothetical protein
MSGNGLNGRNGHNHLGLGPVPCPGPRFPCRLLAEPRTQEAPGFWGGRPLSTAFLSHCLSAVPFGGCAASAGWGRALCARSCNICYMMAHARLTIPFLGFQSWCAFCFL